MTYAAIEAGGTKFVCSVGDAQGGLLDQVTFPTTVPGETLGRVIHFLQGHAGDLAAIGIGSFGPIDTCPQSPSYGYITSTPKPNWQSVNFLGQLKAHFQLPIAWTTDVNAAAYGEYSLGAGRQVRSLVYYTIGTGIGGGAIQAGRFIGGLSHPEMGHMRVQVHPDDAFPGHCPFHQTCLEGLAAGPAIAARMGRPASDLPADDPFWDIEAYYLAQALVNTSLILAPEMIILGGGVMKQGHLLDRVRAQFESLTAGYIKTPTPEDYIQGPALQDNAATIGCFALAREAAQGHFPAKD
ncbi:ROK family protein [Peptococcus simiae]|uniref:ROK family protein n=1 Tax=Peptococcus simiae TaxID=1643805 RepID=UPI00397ED5B7